VSKFVSATSLLELSNVVMSSLNVDKYLIIVGVTINVCPCRFTVKLPPVVEYTIVLTVLPLPSVYSVGVAVSLPKSPLHRRSYVSFDVSI
jgi:hypothetical protein